jgi:hypothetical protein
LGVYTRLTVIVSILGVSAALAQASVLQTYAFSQGGESTTGASGPTDHMANDYPGGPSGKLYQFTPVAGSGVQQSMDYASAALGLLTAASAMNASGIAGGVPTSEVQTLARRSAGWAWMLSAHTTG